MSAAVLKPGPKAEETALPSRFCLEILLRESIMIWELFCHESLAVGNLCHEVVGYIGELCHVLGKPTLEN